MGTSNMFGNISIQLQTIAFAGALANDGCDKTSIQVDAPFHFNCTYTATEDTTATPTDLVLCSTSILCVVDNSATGTQDVRVQLPRAFQKVNWDVQPGEYW